MCHISKPVVMALIGWAGTFHKVGLPRGLKMRNEVPKTGGARGRGVGVGQARG